MKLRLRKFDALFPFDWYVIECQARPRARWRDLGDASVEGTATEMRAIAAAIHAGACVSFTHCAIDARGDLALFWSPRKSGERGSCHLVHALALAEEIDATLGKAAP